MEEVNMQRRMAEGMMTDEKDDDHIEFDKQANVESQMN
jgi:hypothetical protein